MPGTISDYYQAAIWDNAIGRQSFTPPANLYAALYLTPPGKGDLGIEVDGSGNYVRQIQANNLTNWSAWIGGVKTMLTPLLWAAQTVALGDIVSVGWRDAATGGNLLWSCDLTDIVVMAYGSNLAFAAGKFTINWQ